MTGAIDNKNLSAVASLYNIHLQELLDIERKKGRQDENLPIVFDSNESVAWYDLKAGANGFGFECMGKLYLNQIAYFNRVSSLAIPETPENYIRVASAFARGAARHFGKPWGMVTYKGTPGTIRKELLRELYDRGATIYNFWAFHEDYPLSLEELLELLDYLKEYSTGRKPAKSEAEIAIVLPAGFIVPVNIYWSEEICNIASEVPVEEERFARGDLWNCIGIKQYDEEKDPYLKTMKKLGETLETLLKNKEEFDILINDEALKPNYLQGYVQVIVLK